MSLIIKKPLVTEKSSALAEKGIYVFKAAKSASKPAVKAYIERYFKVRVHSINTSICRGRAKRTRLGEGRLRYWKKVFARLKPGEKISVFEGK